MRFFLTKRLSVNSLGIFVGQSIDLINYTCHHYVMERTTISIPEELLGRLRMMATENRTSIAALIREALEEKARAYHARPRSLGIGSSGHSDTARATSDTRPKPCP